jgi:hypothetical protein
MIDLLRHLAIFIWARGSRSGIVHNPQLLCAIAIPIGVTTVCWQPSWRIVRYLVTVLHELGHAIIAMCFGRIIVGMRLHKDSSGATRILGPKGRPISDAIISFAGYPGPAAVATALAVAVRFGREDAALAILGIVFLAMALRISNLWGALELILGIAITFAVVAWFPFELNSAIVFLIAVIAIAGSLRSILEQRKWRRADRIDPASGLGYDALGVSKRLHLPAGIVDVAWILIWFVFAVGATIAATGISLQR